MRHARLALFALATAIAPSAFASERRVVVRWSAPAGCPDGAAVEARVRALAGDGARAIEADATVSRSARGYRLELATGGGTCALEDASCEALADTAAWLVAASADATVEREPPMPSASIGAPSPPRPPATTVTATAPTSTAAPTPTTATAPPEPTPLVVAAPVRPSTPTPVVTPDVPPQPRRAHTRWSLGLGATWLVGVLPSARVGPAFALGYRAGSARIALDALWLPSATRTLSGGVAANGAFTLYAAALGLERPFAIGPIEAGPRLGVGIGAIRGEGSGVDVPGGSTAPWVAVDGGIGASWPLAAAFALRVDASIVVPLTRPAFVIEGLGLVHQPSYVGARLGASGELHF